jgi:hypothetical protein
MATKGTRRRPRRAAARARESDLLPRLFVELFQTEESAREHPRVEAERLGDAPPARALRAVAAHAGRVLPELERLAAAEGLGTSSLGAWIGTSFSAFRKRISDRILDREKSYRGTLIGLHHGIDAVRLLRSAARTAGRGPVEAFCEAWLAERVLLVTECERQLDWFGAHPELALGPAKRRLRDGRRTA